MTFFIKEIACQQSSIKNYIKSEELRLRMKMLINRNKGKIKVQGESKITIKIAKQSL